MDKQVINRIIEQSIAWAVAWHGSRDYQHLCLKFVEDAIEQSSAVVVEGQASAWETAEMYAGDLQEGEPPKGSYVFYRWEGEIDGQRQNWGHVGLCLGGGRVVHAWGEVRIDHYLEIEHFGDDAAMESPRYAGWVPLARFLSS